MLRNIYLCTVKVPQHVTIVGVRHAPQWQPETLQQIKNIIDCIVIVIYVIGILRTITAGWIQSEELPAGCQHQKLGFLESGNYLEACCPVKTEDKIPCAKLQY